MRDTVSSSRRGRVVRARQELYATANAKNRAVVRVLGKRKSARARARLAQAHARASL